MHFFFFCYLGICLDSLAHNLQFKFLSASRRNPLPWPKAGSVHALHKMDSVIRDLMAKGNPNPKNSDFTLLYFALLYFHTCRSHTNTGPPSASPGHTSTH